MLEPEVGDEPLRGADDEPEDPDDRGAPDGDDVEDGGMLDGTDAPDPGTAEPDDGFDDAGADEDVDGFGAGRVRRGETDA